MLKIMLIVFLVQWIIGFAMMMYAANVDTNFYDEGVEVLYKLSGSYRFSCFVAAVVIVLVSMIAVPMTMILYIVRFLHREEL